MLVLGLGLLGWYYRQLLARPARAQESAQSAVRHRVQGDTPLPGLGRIEAPSYRSAPAPLAEQLLGPAPELPEESAPPDWPAEPVSYAGPAQPTAADRALERRLAGAVFTRHNAESAAGAAAAGPGEADAHIYMYPEPSPGAVGGGLAAGASAGAPLTASTSQAGDGNLSARLRPTADPGRARTGAADAATAAAEGRVHRLHARDRDRLDAARHDDLRDGDGQLQRGRQGGAARARHQARRRDARAGAAGGGARVRAVDGGAHADRRRRAACFAGHR